MPLVIQLFGDPKDRDVVMDHFRRFNIALEPYVPQKRVMPPLQDAGLFNPIAFNNGHDAPDFSGPDLEADIDKLFAALQRKMVTPFSLL